MNPKLNFEIYSSTSEFPKNWDTFSAKNIFLSQDYLSILEVSSPKNMKCNFIGFFQNQELVGIALTQFIDLSAVSSFGDRDNCVKTKIRNFAFKRFSSNILILGNNTLTGQNAFNFSENIPVISILTALNDATKSLKMQIQKNGNKVHLIIFKDFSETQITKFDSPEYDSFYKFSTQPNMVFDIKKNWTSFDSYVSDLNKKYRDQYKRARKKAIGITKQKMSIDDVLLNNARINELYFDVAKNAPFNTFFLTENHFETFKIKLKENFLFYGYFNGETLIGFNTLIKNGNVIDTYFLGYDEKCQREKMLYLNMLYDMIGYSINKRFNRIVFARTALEIKSSVGAKPEKMYGLMKHSNWFINLFIGRLFRYFEPEMIWTERNPFK